MANINWESGSTFNESVLGNDISVYFYGNYGGPGYPEELVTKKNGDPLSQHQLEKKGLPALDKEDYFFYVHDVESQKADTVEEQALADIHLINSLTDNDASYSSDPEALLYDGIATFGMIGSLLLNDSLDLISPTLLVNAVTDAVDDLTAGIEGLAFENPDELTAILAGLFNDPPLSPEFTFDFTFPDIGSNPELTEFLVVNAVAAAINEPGDPPAYNPLSDDYKLVLHANTLDFDLLVA